MAQPPPEGVVTSESAVRHCDAGAIRATLMMARCVMLILIMAAVTLLVFLVMGGLLFAAGVSERRHRLGPPRNAVSIPRKAA